MNIKYTLDIFIKEQKAYQSHCNKDRSISQKQLCHSSLK
jgi:hypothetical protein